MFQVLRNYSCQRYSKNIRKIVDEETLGISLSERTGFQILFGEYLRVE